MLCAFSVVGELCAMCFYSRMESLIKLLGAIVERQSVLSCEGGIHLFFTFLEVVCIGQLKSALSLALRTVKTICRLEMVPQAGVAAFICRCQVRFRTLSAGWATIDPPTIDPPKIDPRQLTPRKLTPRQLTPRQLTPRQCNIIQ